jgi:hypothetical protein
MDVLRCVRLRDTDPRRICLFDLLFVEAISDAVALEGLRPL